MSIESDADRLDFVRTLASIETDDVEVLHPGGKFSAMFDHEYYEAQFGAGPGVDSVQLVLTARTIDVAALIRDTPLTIGTEEYRLKSAPQPMSLTMSRLLLKR